MRLRMLTCARGEINADPDDVVDVEDPERARALIEGGFAEPAEEEIDAAASPAPARGEPAPEAATDADRETATQPRPRGRRAAAQE